ncbi:hypothetical protein, partial [Pseudomonas sp. GM50]|uniref:hypothetical protein n=1 Tax=Pseudomonas sp. GM50 TaxID=1144332 RepID=UPI001EE65FC0
RGLPAKGASRCLKQDRVIVHRGQASLLRHRKCSRGTDDRPWQGSLPTGSRYGLGKNPLRRVFFRLQKTAIWFLVAADSCYKCRFQALNGQWLTRSQWYVVFLSFTDAFNLDPSTEAQDVLRITDDRPYARMAADRMSQWS